MAPGLNPRIRRSGALALLAIVAPFALAAFADSASVRDAAVDVNDFTFASADVVYDLSRSEDGGSRLRVTEKWVAEFPDTDQNRGMQIAVGTSWEGEPTHPKLLSITDENGVAREKSTDDDDGDYIMTSRAADFVHGEQTYVFTYEMENVITDDNDPSLVQAFYWNAIGRDFRQPVGEATITVNLDSQLASATTGSVSCYVKRETDDCRITLNGDVVIAESGGEIAARSGMSVGVGFVPGTFVGHDTSLMASPWGWMMVGGVVLGFGALIWRLIARVTLNRDEPGRPSIIVEHTPPTGVSPAEAAVLAGRPAASFVAEVVGAAVSGAVSIEEIPSKSREPQYAARLIDGAGLTTVGKSILSSMFGPNGAHEVFRLNPPQSDQADRLAVRKASDRAQAAARAELTAKGAHLSRRSTGAGLAAGISCLLVIVGSIPAFDNGVDPTWPILAIIVAVVLTILTVAFRKPHRLSAAGSELRDHLRGLEEFIDWTEEDRLAYLQTPQTAERAGAVVIDRGSILKLYEPLLAYAIALGKEKQWLRTIETNYGSDAFGNSGPNTIYHTTFMSQVISSTSAASMPDTSASSASSGGGSAGGGGGSSGGGGV